MEKLKRKNIHSNIQYTNNIFNQYIMHIQLSRL